jgi:diguanylate cyclase (GGDEF)-like protein/PAS domain S-box-containing protein/putative nucleotidyltransferase with HDIG domain
VTSSGGKGVETPQRARPEEDEDRSTRAERAERLLRGQQEVAAMLAEGDAGCLPRVLEAACRSLGWSLAEIWRTTRAGTALRCAATWSEHPQRHEPMTAAGRATEVPPGVGLPGRAWAGASPTWTADAQRDPTILRPGEAAESGLRGGLAVPLRVGGAVFGALAMHREREGEPDPGDLEFCLAIGAQLAQFLALQESWQRFEAVAGSVADAIVTTDEPGNILSWNAGAARIFGYDASETVGQPLSILMLERPDESEAPESVADDGLFDRTSELTGVRKGGERFPLEVTVTGLAGDEPVYSAIMRDITERKRAEELLVRERSQRALTAEQSALRRVATAVASGADASVVFDLAAREVSELVGADSGAVIQFGDRGRVVLAGRWGETRALHGETFSMGDRMPAAAVFRGGGPTRVDDLRDIADDPGAAELIAAGYRSAAAAPVHVGERLWGAVATATRGEMPRDAASRLEQLAYLVALTVGNAEARSRLIHEATTDPLTGLANHRTFHERLREEVQKVRGQSRDLALAMIDLDHFKHVNDTHGHQAGDRVLSEAGRRLLALSREGELVARVNGGGFAWILPGTDSEGAFAVAERARRAIADTVFPGIGTMSASAGVCDLAQAGGSGELLVQLTDGALYWAKSHGRDVTFRYTPEVVEALSAAERAERLERGQTLMGLRALARAVDAKDPSTQAHSERVSELSVRIARAAGLSAERTALLREAALIHDVGKIGVPDAVLFKPGRLTEDEYELVKQHADLGAEIAAEVLTPEQVSWIRAHHERWDGTGYPRGLTAEAIPPEACILALADAWDVMTNFRLYRRPVTTAEAMEECRRQAGTQFGPSFVLALESLFEAGVGDPTGELG